MLSKQSVVVSFTDYPEHSFVGVRKENNQTSTRPFQSRFPDTSFLRYVTAHDILSKRVNSFLKCTIKAHTYITLQKA